MKQFNCEKTEGRSEKESKERRKKEQDVEEELFLYFLPSFSRES